MSDYSQEQIDAAMRKYSTSAEGAARVLDAVSTSARGASGSLRGLEGATSTVASAFKGLASGSYGITSFGSTLSGMTQAMSTAAKAIPVAGKVVSVAIDALGSATEVAIAQMDIAMGSYQQLSQSGFSASDGMDAMRENFVKAGIPLKMYSGILAKNSKSFINLSGSADKAAEDFSATFAHMRAGADQQLRNMGFNSEEIGDTLALFVDRQRRLGTMQGMDQFAVSAGAIKLGKELEEVAKLTGASRQEQREALKQAMLNARYNASQRKLRRSGKEGVIAADNIQEMVLATQNLPGLSKAIQDASTGFINSPEARQWAVSIPGFMKTMNQVRAGTLDWASAMDEIQQGGKKFIGAVEDVAIGIGDTGILAPMNEMGQLVTMANGSIITATLNNKKTANDIADMHLKDGIDGKGKDSITVELTKAAKNLEQASANISGALLTFETVSGAIESFSETIKYITQEIYNSTSGINKVERGKIDARIDKANFYIQQAEGLERRYNLKDTIGLGSEKEKTQVKLANEIAQAQLEELKTLKNSGKWTIGKVMEEFRRNRLGVMGTGAGAYDREELRADLQSKTGINPTTPLTDHEAKMLRAQLQPVSESDKSLAWHESSTGWNPDNWQILKDFSKIIEGIKVDYGTKEGDIDTSNQLDNTTSLDKTQNEKITNAMSSLSNSNIETNKKLDSIVTALNQGNKNTQGIKQHIIA